MKVKQAAYLGLLPTAHAADTIVGVYMFHRHGDRTPKILPPTTLTDLGYNQVYLSGQYYRGRYVESGASSRIMGMESDIVNELQIAASAPLDPVLQNSAQGFLQGLYPPVGPGSASSQVLRNGTTIQAPMDGYQLIPVNLVEGGGGSENSGWLQDATACANAEISSNNYFYSEPYKKLYQSTMDLYQGLLPLIGSVFDKSDASFFNAYTIYDYLNVAHIHNQSFSIAENTFHQLHALANVHEYNLAFNSSSTIRAIAGKQLAAEIVQFLDDNIASQGENKLGIQFGSYGTFFSFFGLAQLPAAAESFYGVADYASAMTFELYTTETFDVFPTEDQLRIRFFYHNGTTMDTSPPTQYPLFGRSEMSLSWADFKAEMGKFSIGNTAAWCHACGNTTGTCLPYSIGSSPGSPGFSATSSSGGLSNAVCGVIGAMVTLGVILIIEGLIILFGGFAIVKKNRLVQGKAVANGANGA